MVSSIDDIKEKYSLINHEIVEEVELDEDKEIADMIKHYEDMLKSLERKKKKTH